jgi:hypothetical protein
MSDSEDPGEAAEAHAMDLAVDPGIDTSETDMLGLAAHVSSLANFITWILRGDSGTWKRPEPIRLPNGTLWNSGAFLGAQERSLRRVALVDRWDAWTQTAMDHAWNTMGECSVYQTAMDVMVVEIGSLRKGRWSNPFTIGYRHPVAKVLRFRKRDGDDFGSTWDRVEREHDSATREQWLDALTDDGVLAESIHVHHVDVPENSDAILALTEKKILRIEETVTPPDPQYSQCFQKINPCPFRSCCPRGIDPSPEIGFIPTSSNQ